MGCRATVALLVIAASAAGCGASREDLDFGKGPACQFSDRPGGVYGEAPTDDPVAACRPHYTDGTIPPKRLHAPPLVLCVGKNSTPWVFPSNDRDLCDKLDLPDPTEARASD